MRTDGIAPIDLPTSAEGKGTVETGDAATADSAWPTPIGYEIIAEVGRGGMGIVFAARECALGRDVAIKVMRSGYRPDWATAKRFVEEAVITGQLQHPGIPAIHQVGTLPDGRQFLVMKLIRGQTLSEPARQARKFGC